MYRMAILKERVAHMEALEAFSHAKYAELASRFTRHATLLRQTRVDLESVFKRIRCVCVSCVCTRVANCMR